VKNDLTFTGTGQLISVHPSSACEGRGLACCIHAPSAHHMTTWPMHWRADTLVMERTCPHGIGHPDPDHMAYVRSLDEDLAWQGVHGCDGCCQGRK
jgi:hypothetical protein